MTYIEISYLLMYVCLFNCINDWEFFFLYERKDFRNNNVGVNILRNVNIMIMFVLMRDIKWSREFDLIICVISYKIISISCSF